MLFEKKRVLALWDGGNTLHSLRLFCLLRLVNEPINLFTVRNPKLLAFIVCSIWLIGCSTATNNSTGNFGHPPQLHLKQPLDAPSSKVLLHQFAAAHARADSLVRLAIPDARDRKFLLTHYGFSYPYWVASATDTLPGPAQKYEFNYSLMHQGDTIESALLTIGPDLRVYPSELAELVAYQRFLTGDLEIGPKQAVGVAVDFGVKQKGAEVGFYAGGFTPDTLTDLQQASTYYQKLIANPKPCYWLVENNCDGCVRLKVNASNGKVFDQDKVMFMY